MAKIDIAEQKLLLKLVVLGTLKSFVPRTQTVVNTPLINYLNLAASQQQQPNTQPALLADWIKNYG